MGLKILNLSKRRGAGLKSCPITFAGLGKPAWDEVGEGRVKWGGAKLPSLTIAAFCHTHD